MEAGGRPCAAELLRTVITKGRHVRISTINMADIGSKLASSRKAIAAGSLFMGAEALRHLMDGSLPKGDALALAQVAGVMAAKRTAEIIPLCHPLPLDSVRVDFEFDTDRSAVTARCAVCATAKTGVEMEALSGVTAVLLCLYDLIKPVDAALRLSDILLERKEGGKSGLWVHPASPAASDSQPQLGMPAHADRLLEGYGAVVMTISDRSYRGERKDESGPAAINFLVGQAVEIRQQIVLPDEREQIESSLRSAAERPDVDLIVTTGGTGISPRDVTPEAVAAVSEKLVPGFGELMRAAGRQHTQHAYLSRSLAGICNATLIVALPGSPKAVVQNLEAIKAILPHAIAIATGHDHNHAGTATRP